MLDNIYHYDREEILKLDNFSFAYYDIGFYQGILFNKYSSTIFYPKGYSKEEVKSLLENVEYEIDNWEKPNIVIIL
jgi:hypothetical protein